MPNDKRYPVSSGASKYGTGQSSSSRPGNSGPNSSSRPGSSGATSSSRPGPSGPGSTSSSRPGSSGPNSNSRAGSSGYNQTSCEWTFDPLPHEKSNKNTVATGWKILPEELKNIELPKRKGNASEAIGFKEVKVNHFPVRIDPPHVIYRYHVEVIKIPKPGMEPGNQQRIPVIPRFLVRSIHTKLLKNIREEFGTENSGGTIGIISDFFDALFSTRKLEDFGINLERLVELVPKAGEDGRQETFQVKIEPTNEVIDTRSIRDTINNTEGQEITPELTAIGQIYNILLRNLENENFIPTGRSQLICFDSTHPSCNVRRLGQGVMSSSGYDIEFEITNGWKPFLNIMVANVATMMTGRVRDVLANFFNMKPEDCVSVNGWSPDDFWRASKFLETFKVKYCPESGKIFGGTITKLSKKSISDEGFLLNENDVERKVSIYQYFMEKYKGISLKKDGLCLELNGKNLVPAEICEVKKGQLFHRKLTPRQTNEMLKLSKKTPDILKPQIEQAIEDLNLITDSNLRAFGVRIEKNTCMYPIKARIIPAPLICYGGKHPDLKKRARITPADGVWDNWNSQAPFLESPIVENWGILNTARELNGNLGNNKFVDLLLRFCKEAGLKISSPKETCLADVSENLEDSSYSREKNKDELHKVFEEIATKDCKIIFVIVPDDGSYYYGHVKQAAELHSGILTQCLTLENFQNPNPSEIKNIILKMNNKLGGINHTVMSPSRAIPFGLLEDPVLILGADVTHPPPFSTQVDGNEPLSFAALVSSIDRSGMRYMTQVKGQRKIGKKAAEVIQGFQEMVRNSLERFKADTTQIPKKIIYFRDGVGDGQYQELLHTELRQIRGACSSLHPTYQPKITFVTVQKRHKTRFFVTENEVVKNAPAGTIVDTEIVHTTEMDSFLLSHKSILGTSRPTRYHVLWDDSDFTQDQIQQMTYYLCHMYTRCNRAVSIPAPTYYAHHAAARAKVLAEGLNGTMEEINKILLRTQLDKTNPMHWI